jgi:hypothetical protein
MSSLIGRNNTWSIITGVVCYWIGSMGVFGGSGSLIIKEGSDSVLSERGEELETIAKPLKMKELTHQVSSGKVLRAL